VLALRLSVDSVFADLEDVPFIDLPQLGGRTLLRGYSWGRFRDRVAYVASAEYSYPIARTLGGFLFVDAGQVGRDLEGATGGAPRIGYGVGLQLLDPHSLLARAFLASTSDGGVTAVLTFEAPFAPRRREGIR
jgi:outer membrane protein assembly factor BamA